MGFRSSLVSDYFPIPWPDWFREKYKEILNVPEEGSISSKVEGKLYSEPLCDLVADVRKLIDWEKWDKYGGDIAENGIKIPSWYLTIIFLHECEGVSRVQIYRDKEIWSEPKNNEWEVKNGPTHSYCYGCSEPE